MLLACVYSLILLQAMVTISRYCTVIELTDAYIFLHYAYIHRTYNVYESLFSMQHSVGKGRPSET